jgi:sec-independent protein translocase protein TatC
MTEESPPPSSLSSDGLDAPQPLISHLAELRKRLLYSLGAIFLLFPVCYTHAETLYGFLVAPLKATGSQGLIYTALTEAFVTYLKIGLYASFMISFPLILVQVWKFIAPGLYTHEQKILRPFLLATPILFIAGAALAYYAIIPMAWKFFSSFQVGDAEGSLPISLTPKVSEYLSLVMTLLFAFGLSFQLPILLLILGLLGVVTPDLLRKGRRYAIVAILVVAAVITPPDIISQIGLAIPLYFLYEVSILLLRRVKIAQDSLTATNDEEVMTNPSSNH